MIDTSKDPYFRELMEKIEHAYEYARKARLQGKDPENSVEALPAGGLADRVEGLVGPPGIAARIRELGRENLVQIIEEILEGARSLSKEEQEARADQALRTALAIITEGVVAAPIEGISKVVIRSNPDNSEYISVYFSGPIRSAGGTAQGMAVLIAEIISKGLGLGGYRPTQEETERFIEEIKLYHARVTRLQYFPSDDDIRTIIKNTPVCIDGDPTEKREVAIHRDIDRVETNRIRGGMCLVVAEGMAQKAKKLMKNAKGMNVNWDWLAELESVKGKKKTTEKEVTIKPRKGVMAEVVGGRPIFAAPGAKGGFRLRYGRCMTGGIASKSIHPATAIFLDGFAAAGTQLKVEKPGKGCVSTMCDSIEGPVIKLKDGSVRLVSTTEEAMVLYPEIEKILFLGDILVSYGDFLQTNTPLLPAGYCEEWWEMEVANAGFSAPAKPGPREAVEFSVAHSVPLHPRYTYHWEDVCAKDLKDLAEWISKGLIDDRGLVILTESGDAYVKEVLENVGIPHTVSGDTVIIEEYIPVATSLGLLEGTRLAIEGFRVKAADIEDDANGFSVVEKTSGVKLRRKSGTYIGARMGRPEKAKERKMEPPVHALFPIGLNGGKERSISAAAEKNTISVDIARYECPKCRIIVASRKCPDCDTPTILERTCPKCGIITTEDKCPSCKGTTKYAERRDINLRDIWRSTIEKLSVGSFEVKGVQGMISEHKIPEPLEKGILRAKNKVYVFKDGTIRFDSTDIPLTHFRPREIGVGIENLHKLGYVKDIYGKDLENDEQVLELRVQDILIPSDGIEYIIRTTRFIDELLLKFYGMEPFYKVETKEDLLGHLVIGLAPHTSAGITGRIVGFNKARGGYAHPYWHAAKRRNCDGDEDAIMLFMDALLNFSKKYLPVSRGGKMDAPLVVSTILDPREVDDEAHKMEIVDHYPLELYEASWEKKNPSEVKIRTVADILEDNPYSGIFFTHDTTDITGPVTETKYVQLKTMAEKVNAQLAVAEKTRAIDQSEVAEIVINSHFLRDTYGNLNAFSRQKVRCVKCNESYRRPPLGGKCKKCGGRLLLTVTEGSIKKYLDISIEICDKYNTSDYMKQRLQLLKRNIESMFTNDLSKQVGLADFM